MPQAISKDKEDFFTKVFEIVRTIPKGRVCSYGIVGEAAGSRISARMVGWAMNKAHTVTPKVPAHRVVNRNGLLTGKHHFATPTLMQELLEQEGIEIIDDKIINFKKVLWLPNPRN
jgi:methylated-DNA-protein-cysteine methyltransferase related protein